MLEIKFGEFPVLETERLLLRKFRIEDASDFFAQRTNDEVWKYIDKPKTQSVEEALELINKILAAFENNEGIAWVMEIKETKKNIGNISFWRFEKENHRAEIGYLLLPEYWGKGIMKEAIDAIVDYGFKNIRIHSIEANVNPKNKASLKLLEKSGFVQEGYFKENYFFNGKFYDSAIFSLVNPNHEY
ncbi:MAG: GNAT family N-acetyltransferase [Bacteroidia bacterium]